MPSSLAYLTSRWVAASGATTWRDALRVALVASFHMAALVIMLATEAAPEQKGAFILTWGVLNFFWLMLLRRPGIAGALSLAMVVALIQVSEFKYKVIWTTANFVDLMIIDPDTITFLLTIFPRLMPMMLAAVGVGVPVLVMIWRFDPSERHGRRGRLPGWPLRGRDGRAVGGIRGLLRQELCVAFRPFRC